MYKKRMSRSIWPIMGNNFKLDWPRHVPISALDYFPLVRLIALRAVDRVQPVSRMAMKHIKILGVVTSIRVPRLPCTIPRPITSFYPRSTFQSVI